MKPRTEYSYVAHRLDTSDPQNLGDFEIRYRNRNGGYPRRYYHYTSPDYHNPEAPYRAAFRLINRQSLTVLATGGPVYRECMKAIHRLIEEETEDDQ